MLLCCVCVHEFVSKRTDGPKRGSRDRTQENDLRDINLKRGRARRKGGWDIIPMMTIMMLTNWDVCQSLEIADIALLKIAVEP